MNKIPYIATWIAIGIGCTAKGALHTIFIWVGVLFYLATGMLYLVSVLRKNTMFYHTYIGWAWMIPTMLFAFAFLSDGYTSWNSLSLLVFSAYIATIIIWIGNKAEYKQEKNSILLNMLIVLFLACAIASCPILISTSKITAIEFIDVEVIKKDSYNMSRLSPSYYFELNCEEKLIHSAETYVSKEYFDMVHVGDEIPVCIYTGLLGKKFYSFFEDPDSDFYGYNEWTREKYAEYLNETQ